MDLLNNFWSWFAGLIDAGDADLYFALPVFVFLLTADRLAHVVVGMSYNGKDAWANLGVTAINLAFAALTGFIVFGIYGWLFAEARLWTLPFNGWGFLAAFLIHDFLVWVDHFAAHRTGLFWAAHSVHHSSEEFNLTVASRSFFLDNILTRPLLYLMPVFGMDLWMITAVLLLTNVYGVFNHSRVIGKLGWLEYILSTPSNHRVHHGSNLKYLDRNYGQVLIIWDILFGTFQLEEEEPKYGLGKPLGTFNPFRIQADGFKGLYERMASADTLADKLRYLYKPPGWSHKGGKQNTVRAVRARAKARAERKRREALAQAEAQAQAGAGALAAEPSGLGAST